MAFGSRRNTEWLLPFYSQEKPIIVFAILNAVLRQQNNRSMRQNSEIYFFGLFFFFLIGGLVSDDREWIIGLVLRLDYYRVWNQKKEKHQKKKVDGSTEFISTRK